MKIIFRKILILLCKIRQMLLISNKFEGGNRVSLSTKIKNCKIGYGTYIAKNGEFYNTRIGKFNSIGSNVRTIIATHPINFVSTHPAFYSTDLQSGFTFVKEKKFEDILSEIKIGNDVWIGDGVQIMGGIQIGDGAIIGAGAVVTKNIPSYEIWGGVPAKKIKNRFPEEEKKFLIQFKWWDKNIDWIKNNVEKYSDIKKIRRIKNEL